MLARPLAKSPSRGGKEVGPEWPKPGTPKSAGPRGIPIRVRWSDREVQRMGRVAYCERRTWMDPFTVFALTRAPPPPIVPSNDFGPHLPETVTG